MTNTNKTFKAVDLIKYAVLEMLRARHGLEETRKEYNAGELDDKTALAYADEYYHMARGVLAVFDRIGGGIVSEAMETEYSKIQKLHDDIEDDATNPQKLAPVIRAAARDYAIEAADMAIHNIRREGRPARAAMSSREYRRREINKQYERAVAVLDFAEEMRVISIDEYLGRVDAVREAAHEAESAIINEEITDYFLKPAQ